MKIEECDGPTSRRISIHPFNDGTKRFRSLVHVRQDVNLGDRTWKEAVVNWSSIGTVSAIQALQFGDAVTIAAKKAHEWTLERAGKPSGGKS